ncbi:alpha/beta hydrolase [Rhodocytophaga rosea]|uniref:Alpha/beta hydrolase n=1 Tax=Rhodocytophaga rosea TaxID=2704465 RepID=A0A6C0GS99_9BACT|nr:alpha/beta hydrolase [Rhodocytophaga rosea]QHT70350.1 alpha/beta hydrolase [Rhodocytophaga rosea]
MKITFTCMKAIGKVICLVILFFYPALLFSQEKLLGEITEIRDLSYVIGKTDTSGKRKLNLVLPKAQKDAPLLIWIGGGAWSYVDRNQEMELCKKIAKEGIAVASVGHSLSPATWKDPKYNTGIQHPEHIKDVAMAFKWLYDHAAEYGYSPSNIFVGGFSSGGHLAALLSMDERYLKNYGLSASNIRGILPIGGTYDIAHYYQILSASDKKLADSHVKGVFGSTEQEWLDASPTHYMQHLRVPMLLISESNTYPYATFFEEKIRQSGFKKMEVHHFQEMTHGGLWKHMSFQDQSKYRDVLIQFIQSQAQPAQESRN